MPFSDHFLVVNVMVVTAEKNNTDLAVRAVALFDE